MKKPYLRIRGAREHNLKDISLDLPKDALIVFTGLSGSGKSSLAFDTIYAEGQRRYVESLSTYARQFLDMMHKPEVDDIEGLSPAISIEQKTTHRNPRSTVGTVTEIYDYLRVLYARVGVAHSPATGLPITSQSPSDMAARILALPEGERIYLLAPIVRGRKGEYRKEIQELQKRGFDRFKIDGVVYTVEDIPPLNKKITHDIDIVVDRLVVSKDIASRLISSLETVLKVGDGLAIVECVDRPTAQLETESLQRTHSKNETHERMLFSEKFACPVSGFTIDALEPRLFSFNSPIGACSTCGGLGTTISFEEERCIPNPALSLIDGAIAPWTKFALLSPQYPLFLKAVADHFKMPLTTPWSALPKAMREAILHGTGTETLTFQRGTRTFSGPFEGVLKNLERRWRETTKPSVREELSHYQSQKPCEACSGYRLKPQALAVQILGLHIGQVCHLSVEEAHGWFEGFEAQLPPQSWAIAKTVVKEITDRLKFLRDVGLSYLTLSRTSGTLSGGESQRIRLASQIGSRLTGVLYVLDEPSIGLHQRDNARLLSTLTHLRDLGNTVLVVEHDEDAIRLADHVVDIGPGAGVLGGEVVAQGRVEDLMREPRSITGQYLSHAKTIEVPKTRRPLQEDRVLTLQGACGHNLKNIDATFPLGLFTCITGVSGSGKSTLMIDTFYPFLAQKLNRAQNLSPLPFTGLSGIEHLDKIIDIDQAPIGRTPRSNPATYTGVFTAIRDWFSGLPEAQAMGYGPGRFSFNVKGGRCEACSGDGVLKIEMHFLPDVYVTCEACGGKRYNEQTLQIRYKDRTIADVLDMTVQEALAFFSFCAPIRDKLALLDRVGLGYITVGQSATTLSGGEAQRVKLAKELARRGSGRTLYLLDEPTTGLHFHDVAQLLGVLHELVAQGNTVIVIEHNLEVIKTADWVIDLGPEGGNDGGQIVAQGTPEDLARVETSYTGRYLKGCLGG